LGTGLMCLVPSFGGGLAPSPMRVFGTRAVSLSCALTRGLDPADVAICVHLIFCFRVVDPYNRSASKKSEVRADHGSFHFVHLLTGKKSYD
jgi:hypothetical protein